MSTCALAMSALSANTAIATDHDTAALARLRAGDPGAAAAIWDRHAEAVWRVAARCCAHPADAEDVVQEVAVLLLRCPPAAIHGGGLRAWLCLAAASRARNRLRDEGRRTRRQEPLIDRPAAAVADAGPLAERARAALDALPDTYRQPVRLRCVERLEFPLVAAACGIGERTARTRVARGLAKLRAALGVPGTGLAGVALLLPVRDLPTMPASLAARVAQPVAATAAGAGLGVGVAMATVGAGLAAAGCAAWWAAVPGAGDASWGSGGGAALGNPPASATMAALRLWRDPDADLQGEVDLDRLRAPALATPPFNALLDPGHLNVIVQIQAGPWKPVLDRGMLTGGGLALSLRHRSTATGGWLMALDAGVDPRRDPPPLPGPVRPVGLAHIREVYGSTVIAQEDRRWMIGAETLLRHTAAATAPRPVLDAPAWIRFDGRRLLADYVRHAPLDGDPAGVGLLLGDGWRGMAPVLTATAALHADGWHGVARLVGAGPFQLLRLVEGFPPDTRRRIGLFRPLAEDIRLPSRPEDLVRWDAGIDLGRLLEHPGTLGIPSGGSDLGGMVADSIVAGLKALQATGDVSVRMRPGMPAPEIDVVVGIRRDVAGTDGWLRSLAGTWGLSDLGLPATGAWRAGGWGLDTPVGLVAIRHRPGAVAVTLRGPMADPVAWDLGTGPAWMPGDAVLHLDGPRLAPLVAVVAAGLRMTGDPSTVEALDAVARMGRHLPVYRLAYTTTADGFTAEERGAPFLVPGLGFLAGTLLWEADPAAETAAGMGIVRLQRMLPAAPARALLDRLAAAHAAEPERPRWSDLLAAAGVDAGDLVRSLGFADGAGVLARRIAVDRLMVHRLEDLHDVMAITGGSDGRPVTGWELPLGPEASLYLLTGIRIGGRSIGVWIGAPAGTGVRPVEGF